MSPDENLLQLIGEIYDCTLNAEAWNTVLPRIGSFVGASAGGFFVHDSSRRNLNVVYQFATDAEYRRLYVEKYMALDPMAGTYFVLDVGEVFSTSTIMPHAEFLRSRFYRELIQPRGWIDNICVYLDRSRESHAGFALFRSERQGLADEAARARLRLLVPHLRRAVLIGKAIEFKTAEAATFADALDGLSTAMVFVDSTGRITQTNAEGRAMIAERRILHASAGRLVANDPEVNRALQDIFLAADTGDAAIGAGGVANRWSRATASTTSLMSCRSRRALAAAWARHMRPWPFCSFRKPRWPHVPRSRQSPKATNSLQWRSACCWPSWRSEVRHRLPTRSASARAPSKPTSSASIRRQGRAGRPIWSSF